jgi:hypothetical protein
MWNGREIRNAGLNVAVAGHYEGIRGWDRTNSNTASLLWDWSSGVYWLKALASKSTTTWFLTGYDGLA